MNEVNGQVQYNLDTHVMKNNIIKLITTLFGVGYTPILSGTAASVVGMFIFVLCGKTMFLYVSTVILTILAFLFSGKAEIIYGEKDSRRIVIDDLCGMLLAYWFIPVPYDWGWIIAVFLIFRVIDSVKVFPVNLVENFRGSLGIVGDDLVGEVYSGLVVFLIQYLISVFHIRL